MVFLRWYVSSRSFSCLCSVLFVKWSTFRSPPIIVLISSALFFSSRLFSSFKNILKLPSGDRYMEKIWVVSWFSLVVIPAHSKTCSWHFGPFFICLMLFWSIFSLVYTAVPPCIFNVLEKCEFSLNPLIFMWFRVSSSCQCSVISTIWGFSFVRKFSRVGILFAMHCMFWCIILILNVFGVSFIWFGVLCLLEFICSFMLFCTCCCSSCSCCLLLLLLFWFWALFLLFWF
uniref:Uncharacterized protein n=1 Tax=Cacopsylla melanoneura TaxID=428564 RepID=A0A8D8VLD0_9HEMI